MGLDVSHEAWHGAYGAFTRWRHMLAEAAGYAVWEVSESTVMIDWGHVTPANLQGIWAKTPSDPLILLIAHSDCDGALSPEHAGLLAGRLEELLPLLPTEVQPGRIGDPREKTRRFIDGCRAAQRAGEPLEFA